MVQFKRIQIVSYAYFIFEIASFTTQKQRITKSQTNIQDTSVT